jgi:IclR family transcriptional regulator, pca regulon regulatory protein
MPLRANVPHMETWKVPDLAEPRYSQSLERGLAILECFSSEQAQLGVAEVADQLGMSRSSTHRYMTTLVALGFLAQGARRKYRLTLRVTDLGMSAASATGLREQAHADLLELARRSGHPIALATLDGPEVVYVDRVRGRRLQSGGSEIAGPAPGARAPAHCVAVGKILLAEVPEHERRRLLAHTTLGRRGPNTLTRRGALREQLERARKDGLALEDEELAAGRIAIAAPLRDHTGEARAALDITADAAAITLAELADALGPHLLATADDISARLGYRWENESLDSAASARHDGALARRAAGVPGS